MGSLLKNRPYNGVPKITFSGYRNKESSQTTLEAETDEARSKDLKMHVTENNEISSKENQPQT